MSSRRDLLKAGAALGGLAAFAAGFSQTGARAAQSWLGDRKTNGLHGRSLAPEMTVGPDGKLALNPDQQVSYTMCLGCTTQCGVRVRVDKATQTVVRVAGNPYSPLSADPHLPMGTPVRKSFQHLSRFEEKGLAGRSTACGRGNAVLEQMNSPFRVTRPMKRVGPRNSGKWEPISFEQLVKEVVFGGDLFGEGRVQGLAELRSFEPIDPEQPELGPKVNQVAVLTSVNDGRENFMRRFAQQSYGTINMVGHGSYCGGSYRSGSGAAFGDTRQMPHAKPDLQHAEFVIFIGTAPANAGNPFKRQGTLLARARTEGGLNYVVVDPVLTHADNMVADGRSRWVPIKPGADGALAMAMIRWIIENGRYDAAFLSQPNQQAAEAAGEAAWCNATHLVVDQDGHPRQGFFLRGSDLGLPVPEADRYKEADPFVVMDAGGRLVPHAQAAGPAELFAETEAEVAGAPLKLCTAMVLLRRSAQAMTVEQYSQVCGIPVDVIEGLAREFTSHGKKAAVSTHGGTMAGNGFYNAFALVSLNTLVGNLNRKGGTIINAGGFKEEEGPRYKLAEFEGKVKPSGTPLGRNQPYEKSAEFRRRKEAGEKPYPASQPWFSTAPQLATEWLSAARSGYPYPLKALLLWATNPVYGIPGLRPVAETVLGDPATLPLIVAVDCFINETSAYADYIVPDAFMYEGWGFVAAWAGVPTKTYLARWPVVEPKMEKTAEGAPGGMEAFVIAAAKAMGLPGFGAGAGRDAEGNAFAIDRAEDYYLRAAANLAFTGKGPVPDASPDDIALTGVTRIMGDLERTLKPDEVAKTAFLFTRGGRHQPAAEAWDERDWAAWRFTKPLQVYNEAVGTSKDSLSGKRFSGVPAWTPPRFADGTPVRKLYPENEWPLQLISFKSPLQNSYSIAAGRLRGLHPDNPVAINPDDAARLGIRTGDAIRIATPGGQAVGTAVVRHGVRQGVLAVEHGFGHRELGARPHRIGKAEQPRIPGIAAGLSLNDLGLRDPTLKHPAPYVDPVSGTAVRQGIPARVARA